MLEEACITVENTAKGGGVYPEVLFQVAKYWYELYLKVSSSSLDYLIIGSLNQKAFKITF